MTKDTAPARPGVEKLSEPQRAALEKYSGMGCTTAALCRIDVWSALVRKGFLRRSYGPGIIESEITPAGRQALDQKP